VGHRHRGLFRVAVAAVRWCPTRSSPPGDIADPVKTLAVTTTQREAVARLLARMKDTRVPDDDQLRAAPSRSGTGSSSSSATREYPHRSWPRRWACHPRSWRHHVRGFDPGLTNAQVTTHTLKPMMMANANG